MFININCNTYKRILSTVIAVSFIVTSVITPAQAQSVLSMPAPGTIVLPSSAYVPAMISGITIHPENPFYLDFIVDTGNDN